MIDLKQYGYTETTIPPDGLIPGRVIEFRREQYTVFTEQGEVTSLLKGSFYHKYRRKR
jgi:ribosome biogenesis GTPase